MTSRRSPEGTPFLFSEMEGKKSEMPPQTPEPAEDKPAEKSPEKISYGYNCQYCEDVGPCGYCARGRKAISDSKEAKRKAS